MNPEAARRVAPLLSVATAVALIFTFQAWAGFAARPGEYLWPLTVLIVAVVGGGALVRYFTTSRVLVLLIQVGVAVLGGLRAVSGSWLPTPATFSSVVDRVVTAQESAATYAAPLQSDVPSVAPMLIVAGLCTIVAVDMLSLMARTVSIAGIVLLAVYAIPLGILSDRPHWWIFIGAGAAFIAMLYAQNFWEQPGSAQRSSPSSAVPASVFVVGAVALIGALVAASLVPVAATARFAGSGYGGGNIDIANPLIDMRRNLRRGEDSDLIRFRTDEPNPSYLRIATLTRFSNETWSSGDRDLPDDQTGEDELPPLPGVLPSRKGTTFSHEFEVLDAFESMWLPTPDPIVSIDAAGPWKFDTRTRDFIAVQDGSTAAGMSYSAEAIRFNFTPKQLRRGADLDDIDKESRSLPADFPREITNLAREVTAGADNNYARAVQLQQWFREDGDFTYDLSVSEGSGTDTLRSFLLNERRGYCEQFASAMGAMARSLGIPARVAVGFLKPEQNGENSWTYSAHDLHSWPELFFPGEGWVRFEPTPGTRATDTPAYTQSDRNPQQSEQQPSPTAEPEQERGQQQLPDQQPSPPVDGAGDDQAPGAGSGQGTNWLWVALGIVAFGLLALIPWLLRRREYARRWAMLPTPAAAWWELRCVAIDLGLKWPESASPRGVNKWLHTFAPTASDDVDTLTSWVEEFAYAPDAQVPGREAAQEVATRIAAAMRESATGAGRWRARLLPASLWDRPGTGPVPVNDHVAGVDLMTP